MFLQQSNCCFLINFLPIIELVYIEEMRANFLPRGIKLIFMLPIFQVTFPVCNLIHGSKYLAVLIVSSGLPISSEVPVCSFFSLFRVNWLL